MHKRQWPRRITRLSNWFGNLIARVRDIFGAGQNGAKRGISGVFEHPYTREHGGPKVELPGRALIGQWNLGSVWGDQRHAWFQALRANPENASARSRSGLEGASAADETENESLSRVPPIPTGYVRRGSRGNTHRKIVGR